MGGKVTLIGEVREKAYKMLHSVCKILDNHEIPYVLEAGTLLGIIRDNTLLPWDTDLDITITDDYAEKLLSIQSEFHHAGYRTKLRKYRKSMGPFKTGQPRVLKVQTKKLLFIKEYSLMDIFIKYKINDEYYWTVDSKNPILKQAPAHFYDERKQVVFDQAYFWVPLKAEAYLEYHYGPDWRTPVKNWEFRLDDHCKKTML